MSIKQSLYDFSEDVFEEYGFGNDKLFIAFGVSSVIALLAVGGVFIPPLALLMNGLLPILLGGAVFTAAAVVTDFDLGGIVVGAVLGLITGYVGYVFIASAMYVAPATSAFLLTPNVIAGGAYAGGGFFSCMEGIWNGIKRCCSSLARCLCCCFIDSGIDEPEQKKPPKYLSMDRANAYLNSTLASPPGSARPGAPSYQGGTGTVFDFISALPRVNTATQATSTGTTTTPAQDARQSYRRP